MDNQPASLIEETAGMCKNGIKRINIDEFYDSCPLAGKEIAAGLTGTEDARQASTMIGAAIGAVTCDTKTLKDVVESELLETGTTTEKHIILRLVVVLVALLSAILAVDLLFQYL